MTEPAETVDFIGADMLAIGAVRNQVGQRVQYVLPPQRWIPMLGLSYDASFGGGIENAELAGESIPSSLAKAILAGRVYFEAGRGLVYEASSRKAQVVLRSLAGPITDAVVEARRSATTADQVTLLREAREAFAGHAERMLQEMTELAGTTAAQRDEALEELGLARLELIEFERRLTGLLRESVLDVHRSDQANLFRLHRRTGVSRQALQQWIEAADPRR